MKKTVLTFGLISGGILAAMMVLTFPFHDAIGFDRSEVIGYASMVAAFLLTYFGIRSYRDNVAGGSVRFGRAFAVGALIALVASVCYTATWEVINYGFKPDYLAKYQAHELATLRASGATQAELDSKAAEQKKFAVMYENPAINVAMTMIEPLPVGLLMALVSAGVVSRKRRQPGGATVASVA
jgi:hypothetical protein